VGFEKDFFPGFFLTIILNNANDAEKHGSGFFKQGEGGKRGLEKVLIKIQLQ